MTNLDGDTAATIEWVSETDGAITSSSSGYTISSGTNDGGSQAATLEISSTKLTTLRGSDSPGTETFTCNITSGSFTASAESSTEMTLTILNFGKEFNSHVFFDMRLMINP
eukprot:sb/3477215/